MEIILNRFLFKNQQNSLLLFYSEVLSHQVLNEGKIEKEIKIIDINSRGENKKTALGY